MSIHNSSKDNDDNTNNFLLTSTVVADREFATYA